jgi:arginyl-tRNA synthetase
MKSREGTVVDADDLMDEMIKTAGDMSKDRAIAIDASEEEKKEIARIVGLGALKYFILKVDPRKNMLFNPAESIDFNGNTGPFIQYTYARIRSLLRKATEQGLDAREADESVVLNEKETQLVQLLSTFPSVVEQAGCEYSPSLIANYAYEVAKTFNGFYHDFSILKEENLKVKNMRLVLARSTAKIIRTSLSLLGMEVPERM